MSTTAFSLHDVMSVAVAPGCADSHTWQTLMVMMADGSTHSVTLFFAPGGKGLPLSNDNQKKAAVEKRLHTGNEVD